MVRNHTQMATMNLVEPWFTLIYNGVKTIEGRIAIGKWLNLKLGTIIEVSSPNSEFRFNVVVKRLKLYPSLEEFLHEEDLSLVLPGVSTIEAAVAMYHRYFNSEVLSQHDFMAIEVVRCSDAY